MSTLTPTSQKSKLFYILFAIFLIFVVGFMLYKAFANTSYLNTDANRKRISGEQVTALTKQFLSGNQRANLDAAVKIIPEDQRLLINTNVLGVRLAGYLGPYNYGVFDEDNGVRIALQTGARCLILEIDHMEGKPEPVLLYRNNWGIKYSLNEGSIGRVAKNIAGRAFSQTGDGAPAAVAQDPMIVVLYFRNTPSLLKDRKEYIQFLASVSRQLQPLRNLLVNQTPQGDFRRQGLESQLFYMPLSLFQNRILLFTNVDTSLFRNLPTLGLQGQFSAEDDLDYLIHARLYGRESPSPFGATSSPDGTTQPAAVLTTPQYWLTIPPDRITDAISNTKKAWTLAMPPECDTDTFTIEKVKELFTIYGVHCAPFSLADSVTKTNKWLANGSPFFASAWNVKPEPLRFIPPKTIPIQKPMPQMNSVGGAIPSPSL